MKRTDWPPNGWRRISLCETDRHYYVAESATPEAPTVLLLHEFPGMASHFERLVGQLVPAFRVVVPAILGRDGNPSTFGSAREFCVRKELHLLARGGVSEATAWIKKVIEQDGMGGADRSFGVVGMCMTGNFALAVAVDPRVRAAVVAEPALPVCRAATGLSEADEEALRGRTDLQVRGYRYTFDPMSPPWKLGSARKVVGTDSYSRYRGEGLWFGHSVLTGSKHDQTVPDLIKFLKARLSPPNADVAPDQ